LITYSYSDQGVSVIYQGTGVIYSSTRVITSANAIRRCLNGVTLTVSSNVTDINNPTGSVSVQVVCQNGTSINYATGATGGQYFATFAYIDLTTATSTTKFFPASSQLRVPTSSPNAADINKLWVAGYGETFPGGSPTPQLTYIPINPMTNNKCNDQLTSVIGGLYSFSENFCVKGQKNDSRTGFVTDACPLDAGAPVFRTSNINSPANDFEVVGIVNFATCTAATPVVVTYLSKYISFVGTQSVGFPGTASPPNPNAANGNFICGDGIVTGPLEKCDSSTNLCCNQWTCQYKKADFPCGTPNVTQCLGSPLCNGSGVCRRNKKSGPCKIKGKKATRCHKGRCCSRSGSVQTCV